MRQPPNIASVGGLAVAGALLAGVGALFLAVGAYIANPLAAAVAYSPQRLPFAVLRT
jgi:hypothetical protein